MAPESKPIVDFPTRGAIASMKPGDLALDCWGRMVPVIEIGTRTEDAAGHLFVHYYTEAGAGGRCSMGRKESTITRTVALSNKFTSYQLDDLEAELRTARGLDPNGRWVR